MIRAQSLLLCCALFQLPVDAMARTIRVCLSDRSQPRQSGMGKITTNQQQLEKGQMQLVTTAAARHGARVVYTALPWKRCLVDLQQGRQEGALSVAATAFTNEHFALPKAGGHADASRLLNWLNLMVVRRAGSPVEWDGAAFKGVHLPILRPTGGVILVEKLAAMGLASDDNAVTEAQTLQKLAAGRGDVALIEAISLADLMTKTEFQGKFEVLPIPFISEPVYLGFNAVFYKGDPAFGEAIWDEIRRIRAQPDWKDVAVGR